MRDYFDDIDINPTTSKKEYRKILKYMKFMNIAKQIATLSYDQKHQVSAILIKKDFSNIHCMGYNGNYEGGPNERDSQEHGKSGFIHAEENALLKKTITKEEMENYMMFVTMTPCNMCAKKMVNAGIKEVCALNLYSNAGNSEEIFNNSNIEFYYLKDKIKELLIQNHIDRKFQNKLIGLEDSKDVKEELVEAYEEAMRFIMLDFFDNHYLVNSLFGNIYTNMKISSSETKIGQDFYEDFFNILSDLMSKIM